MASLTSAKKHAEMKKKEEKIDECQARRLAFLEARRQQVRDLRNNKVAKKVQPAARSEKKEVTVPLVQPVAVLAGKAPVVDFGFQQGFRDLYKFEETIKKGGFGTVFKVRSFTDPHGLPLAVKVIVKSKMSQKMAVALKKEVAIMAALKRNKNAVRFYGAFEDERFVFILMELTEGKDMTHQPEMRDDCSCDESTASFIDCPRFSSCHAYHASRYQAR